MIFPYLILGDGRYLSVTGTVEESTVDPEVVANHLSIDPTYDPDVEGAPGPAVRLTADNMAYWEAVAARGGNTLRSLLS